jgi:NAD(P)-dependent dehydrogenase (short-subunit alcohol dehydrogenase family)
VGSGSVSAVSASTVSASTVSASTVSASTGRAHPVMPRRMAGRRALVTGGAGAIGLACARRLLAEGAEVVLLDRHADALSATAGTGAAPVACDVRDPGAVAAAVTRAAGLLNGPADVLVNSAGVYRIAPLLDLTPGEWDDVLAVNLRGTFLAGRAMAAALIAAGRPGAIVNISSTAGLVADAAEPSAHYNASKAGVLALTRQMAAEWAPHGIRANAVCPGVIDTPMLRMMDDPAAGAAYLRTGVPQGRLGSAEEVAAAVVFLASDDASYLTGATVPVDGGVTAI